MSNPLFKEARELMKSGEMPSKVSNRLLWAAVHEVYVKQDEINGLVNDVKWLKWAVRVIVTGLVGVAYVALGL